MQRPGAEQPLSNEERIATKVQNRWEVLCVVYNI
jgi:hypothetical protein